MNKKGLLQIILLLVGLIIFLIVLYKNHDNDYYDNYNRVIQEPDSIKAIELR